MATLTPTLTLVSTDIGSDNLSLSATDSLTVKAPLITAANKVANVGGGTKVDLDSTGGGNKFVYVKHTGFQADGTTSTTNQLEIHIHDGSQDRDIGKLNAGEFLFMPILSANHISVVSGSTQQIQVEYAFFTLG